MLGCKMDGFHLGLQTEFRNIISSAQSGLGTSAPAIIQHLNEQVSEIRQQLRWLTSFTP